MERAHLVVMSRFENVTVQVKLELTYDITVCTVLSASHMQKSPIDTVSMFAANFC